jgi:hypothetical protein
MFLPNAYKVFPDLKLVHNQADMQTYLTEAFIQFIENKIPENVKI